MRPGRRKDDAGVKESRCWIKVGAGALVLVLLLLAGHFLGRISVTNTYLITKYYRFESIDETGLMQQIQPACDYIESLDVFLANLESEEKGSIVLELKDMEENCIFRKKYAVSSLSTGEFHRFRIGKAVKPGEIYGLHVFYQGEEKQQDKLPQVMVSERSRNLPETMTAYKGGQMMEYNMAISYHYFQKKWFGI